MLWSKGRAQKALNIASNWAHNQELQFSSKKTEIDLFTNKRKPDFGTLRLNGRQLENSKEATLLGVTLDSKLSWKPHITRIARKATAALLQYRQIMGIAWGLNPTSMRWVYTAMIRPVITYACASWVGEVNKKYLEKKLSRVQRLACLIISSAFPSTPTGALEMLLNIMPINEFILSEAVRGSYRLSRVSFWPAKTIGSTRKTKSHVDVCNEAKQNLPLRSMPADLITKTKVFGKQYKCLVMERKDEVQYENALEPSIIRCYTDGSKLNGRAGASFYIEYASGSQTDQNFFHLGRYSTVFHSGVRTERRGGVGGQTPPHRRFKKNQTSLFETIRLFSCKACRNCCHVFLCYPTCLLISRNFHCDAIIPVVKLFWWVALGPTTNTKCKPGQSQWVLLKLESSCDVVKRLFSTAIKAGQHNVHAQEVFSEENGCNVGECSACDVITLTLS